MYSSYVQHPYHDTHINLSSGNLVALQSIICVQQIYKLDRVATLITDPLRAKLKIFHNLEFNNGSTCGLKFKLISLLCLSIFIISKVQQELINFIRSSFILPSQSVCRSIFSSNSGLQLLYKILLLPRPLIYNILDSPTQYLANATFGTSLAFQMKQAKNF